MKISFKNEGGLKIFILGRKKAQRIHHQQKCITRDVFHFFVFFKKVVYARRKIIPDGNTNLHKGMSSRSSNYIYVIFYYSHLFRRKLTL